MGGSMRSRLVNLALALAVSLATLLALEERTGDEEDHAGHEGTYDGDHKLHRLRESHQPASTAERGRRPRLRPPYTLPG